MKCYQEDFTFFKNVLFRVNGNFQDKQGVLLTFLPFTCFPGMTSSVCIICCRKGETIPLMGVNIQYVILNMNP